LLVIENDEKHLADAKEIFESIDGLQTQYASDWMRAQQIMFEWSTTLGLPLNKDNPLVDGVITDLYFPMYIEDPQEIYNDKPNGLIVAATCQNIDLPYVICTAGYHHGSKYEWANKMHRAMRGPEMIDASRDEYEANQKNWKEAYDKLKKIIEISK